MPEPEWPLPPIRFEDLADVIELLGRNAEDVLRGWILVPGRMVKLKASQTALGAPAMRRGAEAGHVTSPGS
jgi:hypothetical protein